RRARHALVHPRRHGHDDRDARPPPLARRPRPRHVQRRLRRGAREAPRAAARAAPQGLRVKSEQDELKLLLRSRFPVIVVETAEELRFLKLVETLANLEDKTLFTWSVVRGL